MNVLEELVLEYSGWQMIDYECCMCMCLWQKKTTGRLFKIHDPFDTGKRPLLFKGANEGFPNTHE